VSSKQCYQRHPVHNGDVDVGEHFVESHGGSAWNDVAARLTNSRSVLVLGVISPVTTSTSKLGLALESALLVQNSYRRASLCPAPG